MPTLGEIAAAMERLAPSRLAESWDKVGLQIGNPSQEVSRIVTTLECDPSVVAEAREAGAQAIVAHHPLLFRPTTTIRTNTYNGRTIADLMAGDLGFIAAHTNVDKTRWGTNGLMAKRLKLANLSYLHPEAPDALEKLVVFVPTGHYSKIIDAIDEAGGGCIGRYRRCTFRTRGTGGFQGDESTNPTIGEAGKYEETDEWRLETIAPASVMPRVVAAVIAAHPYEEVAYDRYPLAMRAPESDYGLGMVGDLTMLAGETLRSFAKKAAEAFRTDYLQVIGTPEKAVHRVAVSSGAGNYSVSTMRGDECDVLVTGEITYHTATEARHKGLAVVCVGHFASEVLVAEAMAKHLMEEVPGLEATASKASSDPIWIP